MRTRQLGTYGSARRLMAMLDQSWCLKYKEKPQLMVTEGGAWRESVPYYGSGG